MLQLADMCHELSLKSYTAKYSALARTSAGQGLDGYSVILHRFVGFIFQILISMLHS